MARLYAATRSGATRATPHPPKGVARGGADRRRRVRHALRFVRRHGSPYGAHGAPALRAPGHRVRRGSLMRGRVWRLAVFLFVLGFTLNLVGIVSHVVVSSLAKRWFATPLPGAFTTEWYAYSWREFQLADVLTVTATVAVTVTALALLLGFPAAYVLARRGFPAKNAVLLLYFLPLLIPQMTYGIPLATSLYRYRIGGAIAGAVPANLVPLVPPAHFSLPPVVAEPRHRPEGDARRPRARPRRGFRLGVLPLALPGLL